jgi:hypothetical protein
MTASKSRAKPPLSVAAESPFGRGNGLRQQASWAALHSCRMYNGHGTGIGLDYHFRARANMSQKGGKVTRRFGFGDMEYSDLGGKVTRRFGFGDMDYSDLDDDT